MSWAYIVRECGLSLGLRMNARVIFWVILTALFGCGKRTAHVSRGDFASEELASAVASTRQGLRSVVRDWINPTIRPSDWSVEEWWCSPDVSEDDCWTGAVAREPQEGSHWRSIGLERDVPGAPISGMTYLAGSFPVGSAWAISLSMRLDEQLRVTRYSVVFTRMQGQIRTNRILMSPGLRYTIEQTNFTVPGPQLQQLWSSPVSLQQSTNSALSDLLIKVEQGLDDHAVEKCSYGRYWGDQNPRCNKVPLTSHEEEQERRAAQDTIQQQQRLLRTESEALSQRLQALVPEDVREML